MDRLTREWLLEERKFWADQVKTNTPLDIGIRLRVATCDLALSALSQEAVRDEALDAAAKVCEEVASRLPREDWRNGSYACATAIRLTKALKREPNAAVARCPDGLLCPRDYKRAQLTQQELNNPAPAAPVAEMVRRLNELPWPKLNYPDEAEMRDLGYAALPLLQELAALLAKLGQTKQGFFAIGCSNEGQTLWLSKFNGGVNGSWTENPQEAFVFIHKKQADDVMTIPGIAAYQPFCQWIPPAPGASDD